MACETKFPNDLPLSCVIALIGKTRSGLSIQILKEWLWVAGCLVEKFSPVTLPPTSEIATKKDEDKTALNLDGQGQIDETLDVLLAECEQLCKNYDNYLEDPVVFADAKFDWTVLIPIVLQIIELIMKRQKPALASAPKT